MLMLEETVFLALYYLLEIVDLHNEEAPLMVKDGTGCGEEGPRIRKMIEGIRENHEIGLSKLRWKIGRGLRVEE